MNAINQAIEKHHRGIIYFLSFIILFFVTACTLHDVIQIVERPPLTGGKLKPPISWLVLQTNFHSQFLLAVPFPSGVLSLPEENGFPIGFQAGCGPG